MSDDKRVDETASLSSLMKHQMEDKPELLSPSAGMPECCIFRVPPDLLKISVEAFYPLVVSIGPYHYGEQHLQMLQEQKWRLLSSLLTRCEPYNIHLEGLIDAISPEEKKIRGSYSECIDKFSRSELIMMMVLDGCFIIEVLATFGGLVGQQSVEPLFNIGWIRFAVRRDLLRLENQIPYFVLEELFAKTRASRAMEVNTNTTTLAGFALNIFNWIMERPPNILTDYINRINNQRDPPKHLLDLYRACVVMPICDTPGYSTCTYPHADVIQSTQMLRKAGIKFRLKKSTKSFLEISFNKGILEIPFLKLHTPNYDLLLNFIAFEQCYRYCFQIITPYVEFMGYLIDSTADSEYLESKEIIDKLIGTHEEVAHLFNQLRKNIFFYGDTFYLGTVFQDINKYCNSNWRVGWGGIKHKYFAAPWAWIAALGAVLGLLLAAIQAVFTVLGYVNPRK